MTTYDKHEAGYVFKPTCFMTNSNKFCFELGKACPGGHEHVQLLEGRAKHVEVYPLALCHAICKGIRAQLDHDILIKRMLVKVINSIEFVKPPSDMFSAEWFSYVKDYY